MLFVTLQTLPSFISFSKSWIPELKPRQVPLQQWALQVIVLTSGSLLNNWAFAYKVPLTILIVIRSAGEHKKPILFYRRCLMLCLPRPSYIYAFWIYVSSKTIYPLSNRTSLAWSINYIAP